MGLRPCASPGRIHHGLDGFKTREEANAAFLKESAENAPKLQLDLWAIDPKKGYIRRARTAVPRIAAILPLESPLCLVITYNGEGLHLDLDKGTLSPVALQVRPLPPPPVNPNLANQEQLQTMTGLAIRVPKADRFAIFEAVNKRTDLTPKQKVELATKQLREYIETKKPGPVVEPPPTTPEEFQTLMNLAKRIPSAQQKVVVEEATKKTDLTDRDRVLWITEQYRRYLERHKAKSDETGTKRVRTVLVRWITVESSVHPIAASPRCDQCGVVSKYFDKSACATCA